MPKKEPSQMLPLAALARRLDLPYRLAAQLSDEGVLSPDSEAGRVRLFRADRLGTLRAQLVRKGVIQ